MGQDVRRELGEEVKLKEVENLLWADEGLKWTALDGAAERVRRN